MTYREHMDYCRRRYFWELLARNGGSVARVARAAGMNRTHAYNLLRRLRLIALRHHGGNDAWRALQ